MVAQSDEAICVCTSSPFVLRVALAVECGHRLVSQRTRAVRLCAVIWLLTASVSPTLSFLMQ